MAKGQKPDTSFWKFLRYAIWPRDFKTADKRIFPWKAELVRIDGSKGRRKDPKLDMRRLALAQFVQERRDQGESYEAAIQGTLEEIKKIAKAEGWGGRIGRDAIKAAYAIHRRR